MAVYCLKINIIYLKLAYFVSSRLGS